MSDVFSEADPNETPVSTPVTASVLEDLVGEGKKFRDLEALAKSRRDADLYIKQLEEENQGLREVTERNTNAEDNLRTLQAELADLRKKLTEKQPSEPRGNTSPELTAEAVEELVATVITKNEKQRTASQNVSEANETIVKYFGTAEKAVEAVRAKARAVGMELSEFKQLAARSPSAFYQIMGVDPTSEPAPASAPAPQNKVNTAVLNPTSGGPKKGTREYYNNLRREIGNDKFFGNVALQQEILAAKKAGTYE